MGEDIAGSKKTTSTDSNSGGKMSTNRRLTIAINYNYFLDVVLV